MPLAPAPFHDFGTAAAPPVTPAAPPAPAPAATEGGDAGEVVTHESVVYGTTATPGTAGTQVGDRAAERLTSSAAGPVGLYKVEAADIGAVDVLRLALYGQYFRETDFPVLQANDERSVGILSLGFAPLKYLDIYGGTQVSSNVSSGPHGTSPAFVGELGDFWLGVKASARVIRGLTLGGDLRGLGFSGVGTSAVGAAAFLPQLLATFDALEISRIPLRAHLNLGGFFGNLGNLTSTNGAGQPVALRAPEQFALDYTPYNEFRLGVGLEAPLPYATLFAEYNLAAPLGTGNLLGPDGAAVSYGQSLPSDADFGVRVTAIRDVSFLAAIDVAFQQRVALGIPILPPWEAFFGVSYNWDPLAASEVRTIDRTRTIEHKVTVEEKRGEVHGTVVDDAGQPVAGALVTVGGSDLPPVATGIVDGKFQSYPLPDGPVDLTITKDGYTTAQAHSQIEKGKIAQVSVTLKREARPITLKVSVHGLKGKPLAAKLSIEGPKDFKKEFDIPAAGEAEIPLPTGGRYALRVSAAGYLGKASELDLPPNQPATALFSLTPEPKRTILIITDKKIRLKKQIHFQTNQAKIMGDSTGILDQVVDAIVKHHIDRIRVEGHTDNVGNKERNLALSQERANAVREYLIKAGIPADHLEAVGYGENKPIAPNMTSRGRALNRRVEFDIL